MDSQEFVEVINEVVLDASVRSITDRLEEPPGRNPGKDIVELSEWYNSLNDLDRQVVIRIINKSVRDTVFSFLCVLDGVTAIEGRDKGILKLYYERRDERVLLNDRHHVNLHELL